MIKLDLLHSYSEKLEKQLRLQTYPIAVKLLETETQIVQKAIRPKRDLGHRLMHCQMFAISRKSHLTVAMLKEDMYCYEPVVSFGVGEQPGIDYFLEGRTRYPGIARTAEAGRDWACALPRFESGKYAGIMAAPLDTTGFEPDLILIYGNSLQLSQLVAVALYDTGRDIVSRMSAAAACVYATVPAIQNGECTVTLPCAGDRMFGGTQDDELIFSLPISRTEALFSSLDALEKAGFRLPMYAQIVPEPKMTKGIVECQRLLGIFKE